MKSSNHSWGEAKWPRRFAGLVYVEYELPVLRALLIAIKGNIPASDTRDDHSPSYIHQKGPSHLESIISQQLLNGTYYPKPFYKSCQTSTILKPFCSSGCIELYLICWLLVVDVKIMESATAVAVIMYLLFSSRCREYVIGCFLKPNTHSTRQCFFTGHIDVMGAPVDEDTAFSAR